MNEQQRVDFKKRFYGEAERKGIEVNAEYEQALQSLMMGENIFINGAGGVGKSELINLVRSTFTGNVVTCGSTGVAASSIGGTTLHSLFLLPLKPISKATERNEVAKKIYSNENKLKVMTNMRVLIIDEGSMVKNHTLDAIDHILRQLRDNPLEAFGGVQVIISADLFQLPPVVSTQAEIDFLDNNYNGSPYFFNSQAYRLGNFKFIELVKIYRQSNKEFQEVLNRFRLYSFTDSDLEYINKRVVTEEEFFIEDDYTYLSSVNRIADSVNERWLHTLEGEEIIFNAEIRGKKIASTIPEVIKLKPSAQIMMLKNSQDGAYFNGSLGIFKKVIDADKILVEIDGKDIEVSKYTEKVIDYSFDRDKNEIVEIELGSRVQYPLRVNFASSIHKSQGQTLNRIYIDLSKSFRVSGMGYVSLSRCTSYEGVGLKRKLVRADFPKNDELIKFIEKNSK